jgi:hypothetical protein
MKSKTRETWKLVSMSIFDCTSITDRWISSSTTYAQFVSRWRVINKSMCTMFTMFHSAFTQRVCANRHRDCQWLSKRRREAHFIKRLQSALFFMKRRDKINSTWRDEWIFKRRSADAIQIHSSFRHYHLRNASFSKHDRFDIHDEKVTRRIYTLHDEIENESKFKSYFDIHKVDVNRKEKRITTSSSMKEHEHKQAFE